MTHSLILRTKILGGITAVLLLLLTLFISVFFIFLLKQQGAKGSITFYKQLQSTEHSALQWESYLKAQGFSVPSEDEIAMVKEQGDYLLFDPEMRASFYSGEIELFVFKGHYYYAMHHQNQVYWVKDMQKAPPYLLYVGVSLLCVIVLLFFLFRYLVRSLEPLKTLHKQIKMFSQGKTEIDTRSQLGDEVAQVANAFHDAVEKINALRQERTLLLRTIMHDMNTPLTRGMLLTPVIETSKEDKQTLEKLFAQMHGFMQRLQEVDKVTANGLVLEKRSYALVDLIDHVSDMLGSEEQVMQDVGAVSVQVDFILFASVLQNLISNAIKYSPDHQAHVCWRNNTLFIINEGSAFRAPFMELTQSYRREASDEHGMGLGLYVSHKIIEHHGFNLQHRYLKGKHFMMMRMD